VQGFGEALHFSDIIEEFVKTEHVWGVLPSAMTRILLVRDVKFSVFSRLSCFGLEKSGESD
jgi:hypothetical protein